MNVVPSREATHLVSLIQDEDSLRINETLGENCTMLTALKANDLIYILNNLWNVDGEQASELHKRILASEAIRRLPDDQINHLASSVLLPSIISVGNVPIHPTFAPAFQAINQSIGRIRWKRCGELLENDELSSRINQVTLRQLQIKTAADGRLSSMNRRIDELLQNMQKENPLEPSPSSWCCFV